GVQGGVPLFISIFIFKLYLTNNIIYILEHILADNLLIMLALTIQWFAVSVTSTGYYFTIGLVIEKAGSSNKEAQQSGIRFWALLGHGFLSMFAL
ncbi:hypothetical protein ACJX0J_019644, partial [Zea mays]